MKYTGCLKDGKPPMFNLTIADYGNNTTQMESTNRPCPAPQVPVRGRGRQREISLCQQRLLEPQGLASVVLSTASTRSCR